MRIIVEDSGQGKTTKLVRMAAKLGPSARIIVASPGDRRQVQLIAEAQEVEIQRPILFTDWFSNNPKPPGIEYILVDDLDRVMQIMFGVHCAQLAAITLTGNRPAILEPGPRISG